jgi:hypothetical protein
VADVLEMWDTYMSQLCGACVIPLTNVYREVMEVTMEIRLASYLDVDSRWMATKILAGEHYDIGMKCVYDELKVLSWTVPDGRS